MNNLYELPADVVARLTPEEALENYRERLWDVLCGRAGAMVDALDRPGLEALAELVVLDAETLRPRHELN